MRADTRLMSPKAVEDGGGAHDQIAYFPPRGRRDMNIIPDPLLISFEFSFARVRNGTLHLTDTHEYR
jgi:hypothetical protein